MIVKKIFFVILFFTVITAQVSFNSKEVFAGNTVDVTVRVRPPKGLIENETKLGRVILFFKENSNKSTLKVSKPVSDLLITVMGFQTWFFVLNDK